MISHVRTRTVGTISVENTHPFRRGRWVFAHNGHIHQRDGLRAKTSANRLAEMNGHTDSELFFAYLLTELDAAGVGDAPASRETDAVLRHATRRACADSAFGSANFLLSDGTAMYAHRFGRTLFVLERGPRRHAVLVASEAMTDERWMAVEDQALLRIDRLPVAGWRRLAA
jgi:glutamine amidotransferase